MADERDRGLHRHGDPDPEKWQKERAVTGRPNDLGSVEIEPALPNSTLASRRKARQASSKAQTPEDAEDKAVKRDKAKNKQA